MKYFRIELIKSLIGSTQPIKKIAKVLNLQRINSYSYLPANPIIAGSILKLRAKVKVDLFEFESKDKLKQHESMEKLNRKPKDGFTIAK